MHAAVRSGSGWIGTLAFAAIVALLVPMGSAAPALVRPATHLVKTCHVGSAPYYSAFDPVNHWVYVPNSGSGNISILKSLCGLVATITLPSGAGPGAAAFDPQNNYIYVTDPVLNQVYIVSGKTVVHTISGPFASPADVAYDPGDGIMLVSNFFGANVTAVSGFSTVGPAIAVGSNPEGIAYDPFYSTVLIANAASNNVTILNATFPFTGSHGSAPAGRSPYGIVYDPHDQLDYVSDYNGGTVVELSGLGVMYYNVSVGTTPVGVAFSQKTLDVYVTNRGSDSVWVLNGSTVVSKLKLPTGSGPSAATYSDFTGDVYVSGFKTSQVYVVA